MPSLPTVPEPKVGIATRPARSMAPLSPGLRSSPLVSLRATASGVGAKLGMTQVIISNLGHGLTNDSPDVCPRDRATAFAYKTG